MANLNPEKGIFSIDVETYSSAMTRGANLWLLIQENYYKMFSEFGCTVINYTIDKIMVDYFYSETMYQKFLSGLDCRQGIGMYDTRQVLEFNKIPDEKMVVVQKDGVDTAKYRYSTISKGIITYKVIKDGKKVNGGLTFRIRENRYDECFNFIDTKENSLDFSSIDQIKGYLKHQYGTFKFSDGGEFFD